MEKVVSCFLLFVCFLLSCEGHVDSSSYNFEEGETVITTYMALDLPTIDIPKDLPNQVLDVGTTELSDCGAVDILFVIDNSSSMIEEQEKLVNSVPGFIDVLTNIGVGVAGGMHLGVVSTDRFYQNKLGCGELGAIITRVNGVDCGPYVEGQSYMTGLDNISQHFECSALLGADGSHLERPVDAMLLALDRPHNREGACNSEFHRAGTSNGDLSDIRAPLIVVIITDEDDINSLGDPIVWIDFLTDLRGGSLNDTTIIALLPNEESCNRHNATRIQEFLDGVPTTYVGDVCEDDYSIIFKNAIDLVVGKCDGIFVPEP